MKDLINLLTWGIIATVAAALFYLAVVAYLFFTR